MIVNVLGKPMGEINREKGFYITRRERKRHYFKKYKGYGISTSIIEVMKREGVRDIVLIEITKKGETMYKTDISTIYERGIRHKYKEADYQIILPITEWRREDGN